MVKDKQFSASFTISGIESIRERIPGSCFSSVQMQEGKLGGYIAYAGTSACAIGFVRYDKAIRSFGPMPAGKIYICSVLAEDSPVSYWGRSVLPGDVGVYSYDGEVDFRSSSRLEYAWVSLDAKRAMSLLSIVEPEMSDRLERSGLYRQDAAARRRICQRMSQIKNRLEALEHRSDVDIASYAHALFVDCVAELRGLELDLGSRHSAFDRNLVRRAEDMVRSIEGQVASIADLCVTLNVSRRTLERAFTRTLGVSPKRHLHYLKLCAAREDLLKGRQTVAEVATHHGFFEFGRFARNYRQLFGELPSATMRARKNGGK